MHSVAHFTKPSFRSKTNNQPLKKFLSLVVSWVKFVQNCKILTFTVLLWTFFENFNFQTTLFSQMKSNFLTTFTQLTARLKNFLRGWLLVLGLKEGQVKCAMVCVERGHILLIKHVDSFRRDFFYYLLQGKNCYFETNILSHICKYLYQDIWFCIWLYHGSYKWIIMLEKCGRPDSNGFQLKVWHQWQLRKSKSW